jgi:hypothetical protein
VRIGRRPTVELADIAANARRGNNVTAISPIALEAVRRIDLLFDIERGINGQSAEQRCRIARSRAPRSWRPSKGGCASSALACQTHPRSPSRLIICCAAGIGLRDSSMMAGFA